MATNLTAEGKGRRQKRPPPAFEAVKGGQFLGKEDGRIGEKQNRRRALPVPLHLQCEVRDNGTQLLGLGGIAWKVPERITCMR